ncbi:acyltransferase [Sphingomonas sp. PAMC26645]|uniref:acyltransferase family protein n=1 Tax=Sphingomonas sp. PAMC26645 TaxID=2565555 RepID=UPI0014481291|nr:acyltransferase [Sphingomonas sp. PAMC26645]
MKLGKVDTVETNGLVLSGRVDALDSLRGIAALVVVLHHCSLALGWYNYVDHFGIRIVLSGAGSVILFFVLSGLVLTKTYLEKDRAYVPFAIKRVIRIYLPFAAAILLAAALCWQLGYAPVSSAGDWFNSAGWHRPVTARVIASHLVMNSIDLDNAVWSLSHELRISLLIPFLALAITRFPKATIAGLFAVSVVLSPLSHNLQPHPNIQNYVTSVQYVLIFAFGAMLVAHGGAIVRHLRQLSGLKLFALTLTCLAAISTAPNSILPLDSLSQVFYLIISGAGSAGLICLALTPGWFEKSVLRHPAAIYLGSISYSLYLVHLIVMQVLVRSLHDLVPVWLPFVITPVVAIGAAQVFRLAAETQSQNIGRRAAAWWTGRRAVAEEGFGTQKTAKRPPSV